MKLEALGFDDILWAEDLAAMRTLYGDDVLVGRVAADFGVEQRVIGEFGDERATLTGKLRFEKELRPAVGDFVMLVGGPGAFVVVDILPRRTLLARQAAGKKTGMQTIAANLDRVFVVTSFNEDFNLNRIERYLTAIRDGGAAGVVIVNKADLVDPDEQSAQVATLRERLGDVPIITTEALSGAIEALRDELPPTETASFVGSSGVGKSTLVNAMLGEEIQVTAEVRESDARGRHTTTHREMFILPGGAIVIDTPGMREFQLWDEGVGLEAFDDIEELAELCRFRDCQHEAEPGCAVLAAAEQGDVSDERLESWRKLRREAEAQRLRADEAARRKAGKEFAKMASEVQRIRKDRRNED